ncbi:MAG: response regulator, partial [Gammaproteobacteria bacterium]|nr:response regulator [Gammaproteobacteria bacterium]
MPDIRVHFIDDDPTAGDLFRRFSKPKGYETCIFRDPVAALEDIRSQGSQLVITDLSMPRMSGMDLLEAIRQTDLEVPVIMITGFSTEDSAIKALRLGATDFIKKPFDMDELLAQVDQSLDQAQQRQQSKNLYPKLQDTQHRFGMIGTSPAIEYIYS